MGIWTNSLPAYIAAAAAVYLSVPAVVLARMAIVRYATDDHTQNVCERALQQRIFYCCAKRSQRLESFLTYTLLKLLCLHTPGRRACRLLRPVAQYLAQARIFIHKDSLADQDGC